MVNPMRNFPGNLYKEYPDDDSDKTVVFQADGLELAGQYDDRHVLMYWNNGFDNDSAVTQLIHLTGGAGNYGFFPLQAKKCSDSTHHLNLHIQLGTYTRVQRDRIIELATQVQFNKKSVVNGCRVWMRDLLESLVNDGLLREDIFNDIDKQTPLKKRVAEE